MQSWIVKSSLAAALFASPLPALCHGKITLSWKPSHSHHVAGYYLCWGLSSGVYTFTNTYSSSQTVGRITDFVAGQTYYFAVKAFSSNGTVSLFSNEAT